MESSLARRNGIRSLEKAMVGIDPDFQEGLRHFFGHKTYCREMTLKKDSLIVGKLHRFPCINLLLKGRVVVESETESATYTAPFTWVSPAGTKRAIYVIEDCIWSGMWHIPMDTEDLDEIENYLICEPALLAGGY